MKIRSPLMFTAVLAAACAPRLAAQERVRSLSVDGAIAEAVQKNLALLAERANLSIADAASSPPVCGPTLCCRRREEPRLARTGFDEVNAAGPPRYSVRVDVPFERGGKRDIRTTSRTAKTRSRRRSSPTRCAG